MSFNEEFSEYYEENLSNGKFRRFTETTMNGNKVTGHICVEQNKYYGSLVVNNVNGYETRQYVHGFPKMSYYEHQEFEGNFYIAEKVDGTNIIVYPLYDHEGEFLEAVAKTRRTAVLGEYGDKHFRRMYHDLYDREMIESHIKDTGATLAFELYGGLNKHMIDYDEDLDYCMLARWNKNNVATSLNAFPEFKRSPIVYRNERLHSLDLTRYESVHINSCFSLRKLLGKVNEDYEWKNNRMKKIMHEGVVVTFIHNGEWKFYKSKPNSVYQACVCSEGIPTVAVKHSVLKYFDEHYSNAKENYENDSEAVIRDIQNDLCVDFNQRYVDSPKTVRKIRNVFEAKIADREYDESLVEIAKGLLSDNDGLAINDLMREFAVKYPYLKKKSSDVYNILKKEMG